MIPKHNSRVTDIAAIASVAMMDEADFLAILEKAGTEVSIPGDELPASKVANFSAKLATF